MKRRSNSYEDCRTVGDFYSFVGWHLCPHGHEIWHNLDRQRRWVPTVSSVIKRLHRIERAVLETWGASLNTVGDFYSFIFQTWSNGAT